MNVSTSNFISIMGSRPLSDLFATTSTAAASSSWKQYILPAALGYIILCQALRFRREKDMRRKFGYPESDRAGLARMTNDEAQQIISYIASAEFPEFHVTALNFGLFKVSRQSHWTYDRVILWQSRGGALGNLLMRSFSQTYGVETISRLLLGTRNLTDPVKSLKRYEDTAAIIGEFMINPPTSERAIKSIARMNFLHSKYIKDGSISNADLLYTLSVFVIEPPRFIRLYEWRTLNEMEYCAYGVFWKSVGDAMGIEYKGFLARESWRNGIEFAEDITAWAKAYEVVAMKPSAINNKPARALIPIITYWAPWFAEPFVTEMVCVLMGDRAREAFMLPEPGIAAAATVYTALAIRRFVLRYLTLPRFFEVKRLGDPDPTSGRMHTRFPYGNYPYYIKPTIWNRWGPKAWAVWLYGGKLPGDNPDEYMPQGYTFTDFGPKNRMGLGEEEMEVDVTRMMASSWGGCPFG
ncbi:Uu.00g025120.m01.CDS01 [Anthostomella pinea]|uniref:Uu.00g025120.m01.CDS01 n=1 Tax=Anthostomella pinea TaxID=933095 RepID=A0AAI8V752_9PEZI|nr:Uu.00g025120.m01.CDS01 [Anthostomella pinea]